MDLLVVVFPCQHSWLTITISCFFFSFKIIVLLIFKNEFLKLFNTYIVRKKKYTNNCTFNLIDCLLLHCKYIMHCRHIIQILERNMTTGTTTFHCQWKNIEIFMGPKAMAVNLRVVVFRKLHKRYYMCVNGAWHFSIGVELSSVPRGILVAQKITSRILWYSTS